MKFPTEAEIRAPLKSGEFHGKPQFDIFSPTFGRFDANRTQTQFSRTFALNKSWSV